MAFLEQRGSRFRVIFRHAGRRYTHTLKTTDEGIAEVLAFLGLPDVISFAGGFPDPVTFPRERAAALGTPA